MYLQGKIDVALVFVDWQDFTAYKVSNLDNCLRREDSVPRKLGDMDEPLRVRKGFRHKESRNGPCNLLTLPANAVGCSIDNALLSLSLRGRQEYDLRRMWVRSSWRENCICKIIFIAADFWTMILQCRPCKLGKPSYWGFSLACVPTWLPACLWANHIRIASGLLQGFVKKFFFSVQALEAGWGFVFVERTCTPLKFFPAPSFTNAPKSVHRPIMPSTVSPAFMDLMKSAKSIACSLPMSLFCSSTTCRSRFISWNYIQICSTVSRVFRNLNCKTVGSDPCSAKMCLLAYKNYNDMRRQESLITSLHLYSTSWWLCTGFHKVRKVDFLSKSIIPRWEIQSAFGLSHDWQAKLTSVSWTLSFFLTR